MGKSSPSAPTPPDPVATANAQAAANKDTAIAQAQLNMVDQYTPTGSLVYSQIPNTGPTFNQSAYDQAMQAYNQQMAAYNSQANQYGGRLGGNRNPGQAPTMPQLSDFYTNSDGVPRYQANVTLSPEQQKIFDQQQANQLSLGTLGGQQISRITDLLSTPVDLSDNTVTKNLINEYNSLYQPMWDQRQSSLDSKLANQGITQGSDAWNNAQRQFSQSQNDAYNQLLLSGRQQEIQQMLAQRNQPINEISALMSGSQVSMPQFGSTPQTSVQPTNVLGAQQLSYEGALNNYNAQLQQNNATMGGLFGLGSSVASALPWASMLSDARLKTDITRIGKLKNGIPVYSYRYVLGGPLQIGVLAQEAAQIVPAAVSLYGPWLTVDYATLLAHCEVAGNG